MIAAMMLPTTYPVLGIFRVMTRSRADARRLLFLILAGFFCAWFVFGLIAHALDGAVAWLGGRDPWLAEQGWVAGVAVLASAACSSSAPSSTAASINAARRWHSSPRAGTGGRRRARRSRIGIDHGVFCVGCCWALMLCMFVVGTGSLGWMLALGALMATEKNLPGGARLRLPIGLGLLVAAAVILVAHV